MTAQPAVFEIMLMEDDPADVTPLGKALRFSTAVRRLEVRKCTLQAHRQGIC